jgi:hypothetical protein
MLSEDHRTLHGLRRNGIGARVVVVLARLGAASLRDLSIATGVAPFRIARAIAGHKRECRVAHSLEGMSLIRRLASEGDEWFELTPRGRLWAARVEAGLRPDEVVVRSFRRVVPDRHT